MSVKIVSYYTALYQFEAENLEKSLTKFLPDISFFIEECPDSGNWEINTHHKAVFIKQKLTQPINLGSGTGVTIKELAETLVEIYEEMYGEKVEINWDPTKPNGDEKRLMSTERAESFGIKQKISLKTGLRHTIDYYLNEYKKWLA